MESLGGTYHQVVGDDVPAALLDFARGVNATQLVLGRQPAGPASRSSRPGRRGDDHRARPAPIDVHLVTHEEAGAGAGSRRRVPAALTAAPAAGRLRRWRCSGCRC